MAGKKKILEQPCFSGAPSNKLYPPTSCGRTLQLSCFANGRAARTKACTTRRATPGIGCCSKEFSSWTGSARTIAFAFASLAETCRSSSRRPVSETNDFVAYVDAIGKLDGERCLIEWKTTSSRYSEEPDGLLALDPQLVCYSWMTGISEVAQVVFVRKRLVEVQYLRTTITDEQRAEFGQLVEDTIRRVESAQFLPHSGIRFPQNPCSSCPYVGLCLGKPELINIAPRTTARSRKPWLA